MIKISSQFLHISSVLFHYFIWSLIFVHASLRFKSRRFEGYLVGNCEDSISVSFLSRIYSLFPHQLCSFTQLEPHLTSMWELGIHLKGKAFSRCGSPLVWLHWFELNSLQSLPVLGYFSIFSSDYCYCFHFVVGLQ